MGTRVVVLLSMAALGAAQYSGYNAYSPYRNSWGTWTSMWPSSVDMGMSGRAIPGLELMGLGLGGMEAMGMPGMSVAGLGMPGVHVAGLDTSGTGMYGTPRHPGRGSKGQMNGMAGDYGMLTGIPGLGNFPSFPGMSGFHIPDFSHLGREITNQVEHSLKPVREFAARQEMKKGTKGVTVMKIMDFGYVFLLVDGAAYSCPRGVVVNRAGLPECAGGAWSPVRDVCLPIWDYAQSNNARCFSKGGSMQMVNGQCLHGMGYTIDELRQRCGPRYDTAYYATYEYYPHDHQDLMRSDVRCRNDVRLGFCSFVDK